MTLRIISLSAMNAGEEIKVTLEAISDSGENSSRESYIISSKQYLCLGLSKGECSPELYDEIARLSEIWQAVKRGTALLGYGACSEKALRVKLISKGFDKYVAEDAAAELVTMGLMCPAEDALREAQKLVAKLWGKKRIVAALYEKGYSPESVAYAMSSLEASGVDYVENCQRLISKRYGEMPDDPNEWRKACAALQRYGYSLSEIKDAGNV